MSPRRTSTRDEILSTIKQRGRVTVDELIKALGMSSMGIRQHLAVLERDGLIEAHNERHGPGRPRAVYQLTEAGENVFPKDYEHFTVELLEDLSNIAGDDIVARLIDRAAQRREAELRLKVTAEDLWGRVQQLAQALSERGSLIQAEPLGRGRYAVAEHNCRILSVAQHHGSTCSTEQQMFARLLRAYVWREEWQLSGQPGCRYVASETPPTDVQVPVSGPDGHQVTPTVQTNAG